jgi:hypothetical protein
MIKRIFFLVFCFLFLNSIFPCFAQTKKFSTIKSKQTLHNKLKTAKKTQGNNSEEEKDTQGFIPSKPFFDLVIVGLAEGSLTGFSKTGTLSEEHGFIDGLDSRGRLSLYVRGKVSGKYGITVNYDSEDGDRLFDNLDPNKIYPIYGDGSNYYRDGQSKNKVYVKVDIDKSYLMYGNFATGFTGTEFSSYNRTVPGLKGHYENSAMSLTLLGSTANQVAKEDEIKGNGLSGIFSLTGKDILEGSERIRIETRDRDIPDMIINSQVKMRNRDYTIDYDRRTIIFKEPVPSVDERGNPVYIIAGYECNGREDVTKLGARGDINLTPYLSGGFTYINENSRDNFEVMGVHSNLKIKDRLNIYGEYARSRSMSVYGAAGKVEVSTNISQKFGLNCFYRKVEKKFLNPYSRTIPGSTQYGVESFINFSDNNLIKMSYIKGENDIKSINSQRAQLNYEKNIGTLQINTGYTFRDFTSHVKKKKSHILNLGIKKSLTSNLSLFATEELDWSQENSEIHNLTASTTSLGLEYLFENGMTGYLRQDFVRGDRFDGNNTVLGFRSPIGLGENTEFYAQYGLIGSISGRNNQASVGLNSRINLTEGLLMRLNYERLFGNEDLKPSEAISVATEFLSSDRIKASAGYEIRNSEEDREKLISFYGDGKVTDDLSVIGRFTYNELEMAGDYNRIDSTVTMGLSYRPVWNNKFNLLARYDIRRYRLMSDNIDTLTHIASIEGIYDITDNLEFYGRYACKKEENKLNNITDKIDFFSTRLTYSFNERFSLFGEAGIIRYLDRDERHMASMMAVDYLLWQNWIVEGGYVFKQFEDFNDYNSTRSQGPFLRLVLKY